METGWNTLVGCDPMRIVKCALETRAREESARLYGGGRAAERIVRILAH